MFSSLMPVIILSKSDEISKDLCKKKKIIKTFNKILNVIQI